MAQKPSIPKGTRDFGPDEMIKRTYIFDTIKSVFRTYGFLPLETPAMENLSTLLGKYGDEGDKLLFKILNSGDFLSGVAPETLQDADANRNALSVKMCEKGLRYDLTVPFAATSYNTRTKSRSRSGATRSSRYGAPTGRRRDATASFSSATSISSAAAACSTKSS